MMDALLLRPFQFADYQWLVVAFETPKGTSAREPGRAGNVPGVAAADAQRRAAGRLAVVALTAAYVPALGSVRLDPATVLRCQ